MRGRLAKSFFISMFAAGKYFFARAEIFFTCGGSNSKKSVTLAKLHSGIWRESWARKRVMRVRPSVPEKRALAGSNFMTSSSSFCLSDTGR